MKDYGADPIGNGLFKMIPSGDIVSFEERTKRLPPVNMNDKPDFLIGTLTAQQVKIMQGGGLTIDELAEVQNVKPMADVRALFGTWPGKEDDGFEDAINELQYTDLKTLFRARPDKEDEVIGKILCT